MAVANRNFILVLSIAVIMAVFVGGYFQYSKSKDKDSAATKTNKAVDWASELPGDSHDRCGSHPVVDGLLEVEYGHFDVVKGDRLWSPGCDYIAYSFWVSGTGHPLLQGQTKIPEKEGIYLFSKQTGKVAKVYSPKEMGETPEFEGWVDENTFRFSYRKESITGRIYSYYKIDTGEIVKQ